MSELAAAYRHCRSIAAAHGRTYFLATRLLPARRRPAVHALYAFARTVDDIVDSTSVAAAAPGPELDRIEKQLRILLDNGLMAADQREPVLLALADTIERYAIAPGHFWSFLDSMRMDLPGCPEYRNSYATMADLREYMAGSAAAIGLQLLPVLGTVGDRAAAEPYAAALGEAFQLTNFIRDVGEDLGRDRLYLPADELSVFGVDRELLEHTTIPDPRVRRALAHFVAVNRSRYRAAEPGIELLAPRVRPGIRVAFALYRAILDEIEEGGYRVLDRRAVVPRARRASIAVRELY